MINAKKSEVDKWTGKFKGVDFEINHWITDDYLNEGRKKDNWTYYLILHLDRIVDNSESYWLEPNQSSISRKRIYYDYYKHNILADLDWHGGITYYSKLHGFDGQQKVIKVGCDYSHSIDEYRMYDLEDILKDVENTINVFKEKVNYKYWCCGNGELYSENEGIIYNDTFYSYEYWKDKPRFKEILEQNGNND